MRQAMALVWAAAAVSAQPGPAAEGQEGQMTNEARPSQPPIQASKATFACCLGFKPTFGFIIVPMKGLFLIFKTFLTPGIPNFGPLNFLM